MPGRSTKVVLATVAAALLAALTAPTALAATGPSCFQITLTPMGLRPAREWIWWMLSPPRRPSS